MGYKNSKPWEEGNEKRKVANNRKIKFKKSRKFKIVSVTNNGNILNPNLWDVAKIVIRIKRKLT